MSELIAFEIYRTELFTFNGEQFTVQFTRRKDNDEYALFARNQSGSKTARAFYSKEVASDFTHSTGLKLEDEVYAVLRGDLERK